MHSISTLFYTYTGNVHVGWADCTAHHYTKLLPIPFFRSDGSKYCVAWCSQHTIWTDSEWQYGPISTYDLICKFHMPLGLSRHGWACLHRIWLNVTNIKSLLCKIKCINSPLCHVRKIWEETAQVVCSCTLFNIEGRTLVSELNIH